MGRKQSGRDSRDNNRRCRARGFTPRQAGRKGPPYGSPSTSGTPGTLGTLGTPGTLSELRPPLENLYRTFDHVNAASDPVHIVRRYRAAEDREVVAFCAAGLAFGRVASVLHSIESLLAVMGPSPAAFVRTFDPAVERRRLAPLVHRWIGGKDLAALLMILRRMLEEAGSIEQFFMAGDDPASPDVAPALEAFSTRALATDLRPIYRRMPKRAGVRYFFPRPSAGSACKRLNLFLRWMVRRDAIDLGVWSGLSSARLIVPLDTHVIRLGQCLRFDHRGHRHCRSARPQLRSPHLGRRELPKEAALRLHGMNRYEG